MLMRLAAVLALCLALAGCVLEADPPLFKEADGVLLFGAGPVSFAGWSLDKGAWVQEHPDDPHMTLVASDHHYDMTVPNTSTHTDDHAMVLFTALDGGWYGVQMTETGKKPVYILAKLDGADVLLTPVACSELTDKAVALDKIDMHDGDCTVKPGTDGKMLLSAIAGKLDAPKQKLVPVK